MKKFLFSIFALAMALTANATDALKVELKLDKALVAGGTAVLTFSQSDTEDYIGLGLKLVLPEGVTFQTRLNEDDEEEVVADGVSERFKSTHTIAMSAKTGKISIISSKNATFKTQAGDLFTIGLKADANFKEGVITATEMEFTNNDRKAINLDPVSINTDGTTGALVVTEDNNTIVSKTVEKNKVVITKGNNKWTVSGAKIK